MRYLLFTRNRDLTFNSTRNITPFVALTATIHKAINAAEIAIRKINDICRVNIEASTQRPMSVGWSP